MAHKKINKFDLQPQPEAQECLQRRNSNATFIFDQSSAHASLPPNALKAFDMNKSNGGAQRRPSFLNPIHSQNSAANFKKWRQNQESRKDSSEHYWPSSSFATTWAEVSGCFPIIVQNMDLSIWDGRWFPGIIFPSFSHHTQYGRTHQCSVCLIKACSSSLISYGSDDDSDEIRCVSLHRLVLEIMQILITKWTYIL